MAKRKRLTSEEVQRRVEEIRVQDPERAHQLMDSLFEDVLKAIRDGCAQGGVAVLAAEALKATEIKFQWWGCA